MELNVLVMEDDPIDAEMVERLLKSCQADIDPKGRINMIHVELFKEGLEMLAGARPVDVILLDLHLPDGEGIDLVRQLNREYMQIPIVVLTGLDAENSLGIDLIRAGAEDYICKDKVSQSTLSRTIRFAIERRRLTSQIERQSRELEQRHEELESIGHLASHDLRAPLVNIQGFSVELGYSWDAIKPVLDRIEHQLSEEERRLLDTELNDRIPSSIGFIRESTARMERLIAGILQYFRLGRRELRMETVDCGRLVGQCLRTLEHRLNETKADVTVDSLPEIVADRLAMEQVFTNLLDNALKYLEKSRPGKIGVSASRESGYTRFCIADNGRGISENDSTSVFAILGRADSAKSETGEGVGLAGIRTLIRRHHGDIGYESVPGEGTRFYFTIPNTLDKEVDDVGYSGHGQEH